MRALVVPLVLAYTGCDGCDHQLPEWRGEVTVAAMERAALGACGDGALTPAGAAQLSRPPYLQRTTTTSTTVVWGSTTGRGAVVLRDPAGAVVATAPATYAGDPARAAARLAVQQRARPLAADDVYRLQATLEGLAPGQLYCYQLVGDDDVALTAPAPLTTAAGPRPREPLRFVAVGDVGTGGAAQVAIAKRMQAAPFDLLLLLGDLAYDAGTAAQLDARFFAVYADVLRYVPAYPVIGNHDRRTRDGAPFFEAFVLPPPERYYAFTWGDVHFIALDTTDADDAQVAWLDAELARSRQPWVIVYGHHPLYTNGHRGPSPRIRRAFGEVLARHRVDLVLAGHEHHYERFLVDGVHYVVSGGGGARLTRFLRAARARAQVVRHHYLAFEVSATELEMTAIDIAGHDIDRLRLTRPRR